MLPQLGLITAVLHAPSRVEWVGGEVGSEQLCRLLAQLPDFDEKKSIYSFNL